MVFASVAERVSGDDSESQSCKASISNIDRQAVWSWSSRIWSDDWSPMAQHIYNQIYDLDDALRAVRGTTAADKAKKADLIAKTDKKYDEFYTYAQKAFDLYTQDNAHTKAQDKANYRKIINQLIDYHQRKKQADKVTFYQEKLKTL